MEPSKSLLVALMFVTVLSIGIGTVLGGLTTLFVQRGVWRFGWIPLSWLVLLLLQHLSLFWHTLDLISRDEWAFGEFLYILAGPTLLLLATGLMLPDPAGAEGDDPLGRYFKFSRPFFCTMVVLMLWMVGVDILFGDGVSAASFWNLAEAAVFATLAATQLRGVHVAGTAVAWVVFLSHLLVRGLGGVA